ncbi:MAG: peptidylprolyl isomerase [Sedimentisphaerales bacterium]|nr:peptidylprolyl isomerase [Sedimentisphaerales bacterium]
MRDIIWIGIGAAILAFMVSGCGSNIPQGKYTPEQMKTIPFPNRYDLPVPSGGITLNVASETVTVKDLTVLLEQQFKPLAAQGSFAAFKQAARPAFRETLRSRVTDILLYAEARKKAPENIDDALDKAVESELKRFLSSYDNNRALAENALRTMGYDWKTFRDFQKRLILTQSYLSKEFSDKRPIAHSEMVDYYNKHRQEQFCWEGTIQFRSIDLIPARMPAELIAEGETAETATVRLSVELMDKIKAGEDFGTLAEQYSQGPLASAGGLWRPITIGAGSLPDIYAVLEQKALTMEPGQVAGPLTSEQYLFILKLENRKDAGCKAFEEVQDAIEQQFQFEFRKEQYSKMVERLMGQTDVIQMEQFLDYCIIEAYAMWKPNS